MYLAIKWLVLLTLGMWITLCGIDVIFRKNDTNAESRQSVVPIYEKNITSTLRPHQRFNRLVRKKYRASTDSPYFLNYVTFIAGALVIVAYNRRADIAAAAADTYNALQLYSRALADKLSDETFRLNLNKTAARLWFAIKEYSRISWQIAIFFFYKFSALCAKFKGKRKEQDDDIKKMLIDKIKELGDERRSLGQLLIAAIQENKHIRLQYKLESMAKTRLLRHLDEIRKQTKISRSKYITLKQIYIVTLEENSYLKARAKKLSAEREEVVRNLMILMREIFMSPFGHLRILCSQMMAQSTVDWQDTGETHLHRSQSDASTHRASPGSHGSPDSEAAHSSAQVGDVASYAGNEPLPKLRGLPGEYVWTIKDKNGIIEKLYEYDYGYIYDNGDTIRRIREYTVYHDKDCLLDFTNSGTVLQEVPVVQEVVPIVEEVPSAAQCSRYESPSPSPPDTPKMHEVLQEVGEHSHMNNMVVAGHSHMNYMAVAGNNNMNNMAAAGHSHMNNMAFTGNNNMNNMAAAGHSHMNNMAFTGNNDMNNMVAAGHSHMNNMAFTGNNNMNNRAAAGHSHMNNMAFTGNNNMNNIAAAGHSHMNNMNAAGHSNMNNMASAGHNNMNNMAAAGHSHLNNMAAAGHSHLNNMAAAGHSNTNNMECARRSHPRAHEGKTTTAFYGFVTGSAAFQTFLQNNKNIVLTNPPTSRRALQA